MKPRSARKNMENMEEMVAIKFTRPAEQVELMSAYD